jgi:CheY-like chemotaxis protein
VSFIGFKSDGKVKSPAFERRGGSIKESIMKSVANCMVDWLLMEPFPEADAQIHEADYVIILVDERITEFIQPYVDDVQKQQPRVIALLASEMSRRDVEKVLGRSIHAFEVMSAPFGPRKMARAVAACEKAATQWEGHYQRPTPLTTFERLQAVETDLDVGSYLLQRKGLGVRPTVNTDHASSHPHPTNFVHIAETPEQSEESSEAKEPPKPAAPEKAEPIQHTSRNSRMLLVDDNAINLRLLETFMRKRNCEYSCAENGLVASEVFENALREDDGIGYGIVFMDISMPVMDGLEATRKIRKLEQKQREEFERGDKKGKAPSPALVVALTGLANSQDQTNAFASGVDMFMTKPVKFKEIGRLLDNWFSDKDGIAGGR